MMPSRMAVPATRPRISTGIATPAAVVGTKRFWNAA